jgi:hypothetical protein
LALVQQEWYQPFFVTPSDIRKEVISQAAMVIVLERYNRGYFRGYEAEMLALQEVWLSDLTSQVA